MAILQYQNLINLTFIKDLRIHMKIIIIQEILNLVNVTYSESKVLKMPKWTFMSINKKAHYC